MRSRAEEESPVEVTSANGNRDPLRKVLFGIDADGGRPLPEVDGMKECMSWVIDTGAREPIADPKHFPDCQLVPSAGSLAGQT